MFLLHLTKDTNLSGICKWLNPMVICHHDISSAVHFTVQISICLSVYLSICLSVCLSEVLGAFSHCSQIMPEPFSLVASRPNLY